MGFNLIEMGDNKWKIEGNFGSYEGSFLHVATFAVQVLKFSPDELEVAVKDMVDNNNDIAHFGIYRGFLFSKNSNERKVS